jgi:CheY-like chemotaxis protein
LGDSTGNADAVLFAVSDTGFGIAAEDHERIFQDFSQIENPYQARVRGTGLGLPLSRKLTELLGGRIWVESELGKGSTFYVLVPVVYPDARPSVLAPAEVAEERSGIPVLVLDDSPAERAIAVTALSATPFRAVEADSLASARRAVDSHSPIAAIVDISLGPEDSWRYIAELKQREIPVVVLTVVEDRRKAFALGADSYATKPVDPRWLEEDLYRVTLRQRLRHVMIADDDPGHRYVLRSALATVCSRISEAENGRDALERIGRDPPDLLVVDWFMPELDGFEVIERVRQLPNGGAISILLCTSKELGERERELITKFHVCFHRKDDLGNRAVLKAVVACAFTMPPPTPAGLADNARAAASSSAFR